MKIIYYPDVRLLSLTFAERASTDNLEVAPGVIIERDDAGIVGMTIHDTDEVPGFSPDIVVLQPEIVQDSATRT